MYVLRGSVKAGLVLAWTLLLLPVQLLAICRPGRRRGALARYIPKLYHRVAAKIIGLRIDVVGRPVTQKPALFVANHVSWLDIIVLGALLEAGFIAKSEVATWPGVSLLARLQGSVFIARQRHRTRDQAARITELLEGGRPLVLFPEGTSTDGRRVLEFRSGYFSVAERWPGATPLPVQPVSIAYVRHHGLPIGRNDMPSFAWYGDMELAPHLWALMCRGGAFQARVQFHEAVSIEGHASRKKLAAHCERVVAAGALGGALGDALG